jgi:hypothetical protein
LTAETPGGFRALLVTLGIVLLCLPTLANCDAIVRTQAMLASTIAEYFIEDDRVRLELEIGLVDIEGFRNLLPDEIYEKLGHEPRPLAERIRDFYTHDLTIRADGGDPLFGRVVEIGPRPRIVRNEISGEPLPIAVDDEEIVIFAVIEYPFAARPENLTLLGPSISPQPSIGFVAYHGGIAVNDFRYLSPAQTLELDWTDPWYTSVDTRALRRTYFAPMSGFIYVEPYEVRKEIIARPLDLQQWVDLGLENRETIPVEMQADLLRKAGEFLRAHQAVRIDGKEVVPDLARINFLERTLNSSKVIEPPRELDIYSAILGVIFVYPTDGLPDRVTMDWDLFSDRIQLIPASSVDQAGALPTFLEPDYRLLEWQNFLKNPDLPTMAEIRAPPTTAQRLTNWIRWLVLLAALLTIVWYLREARRHQASYTMVGGIAVFALIVTAIFFKVGNEATLSDQRAGKVVGGLLHNIYRAFDYRREERIYDTLERSVSGDLLERIYLETRKGLELENQGGARAKVKRIELIEISTRSGDNGAFVAEATWNVYGSVGHWGHIHQRSNRYVAELNITPIDDIWKLTDLEIVDEQRL